MKALYWIYHSLTIKSAGLGTIVTIIFDKALNKIGSETILQSFIVSSSPWMTIKYEVIIKNNLK